MCNVIGTRPSALLINPWWQIEGEPRQRQAQARKELVTFRQAIYLSAIHSRNGETLMRPSRLLVTRIAFPLAW